MPLPLSGDRSLRVLLSFSPEDAPLKDQLVRQLEVLVRCERLELWSADRVAAGDDWRRAFDDELRRADVALLLLSADFLASDLLHDVEVPKILARHKEGGLRILPVLLRECPWEALPWLRDLTLLPEGGGAVASFEGNARDAALAGIARALAGIAAGEPARLELPPQDRAQRLTEGIDALPGPHARYVREFIGAYAGAPDVPFCGHEADVAEIEAWLARDTAPPNLLVCAPPGRGKSALLVRVALALVDRPGVGVAFVPVSRRYGTNRPEVFLRCLVARLQLLHRRPSSDLEKMSVDALLDMVQRDLDERLPDGRSTVVLLDGLDEATEDWLHAGSLPARRAAPNRLVVSAREGADARDAGGWLHALGWEPDGAAKVVTVSRLGEADVAAVLAKLPEPHAAWAGRRDIVSRLLDLCEGEPLTLWFMLTLGGLRKVRSPGALASWDPGLDAAFARWWAEQPERWGGDARLRERGVRTMLHLLTVAKGPLTSADLCAIAPETLDDGGLVEETARQLSPLVCGRGTGDGYVLGHPGFTHHLNRRPGLAEWRARLSRYLDDVCNDLDAGRRRPEDVPRYVVLHRAAHLQDARASVASWMGLCTRRWYDAWQEHEHGAGGFLHGVERAWAAATAPGDGGDHLVEEARCALARGSVGSVVANVDAPLLELLLEHELWTPEQALAYVRVAPVGHDPALGRAALVRALVPHASAEMLPRIFDVACDLLGLGGLGASTAIEALLPRMAASAFSHAMARLEREPAGWRAWFLSALAKHVDAAQKAEIARVLRKAVPSIEPPSARARALVELVALVPEHERPPAALEALAAVREIPESEAPAPYPLHALLAATVPEASEEALRAADRLDGDLRAYALAELVKALPPPGRHQAVQRLRAAAETATEPRVIALRFRWLLERVPEDRDRHLDAALDAVSRLPDAGQRADGLTALLVRASPSAPSPWRHAARARAREIVATLDEPWLRLHALAQLRDLFSLEDVWRLAAPVWGPVDAALQGPEAHRFRSAVRVPLWGAPVEVALAQAKRTSMPLLRAEILMDTTHRLPPEQRAAIAEEAFAVLLEVEAPRARADAIQALLPVLPQEKQAVALDALNAALGRAHPFLRTMTLLDLARRHREAWPEAVDAAAAAVREDDVPHLRVEHFCDLVAITGGPRREALFEEALQEAKREGTGVRWSTCLCSLTRLAPPDRRHALLCEGLARTDRIGDTADCLEAAISYAGDLPLDEALDLARWIDEVPPNAGAQVYAELLERVPDARAALFESACAAARKAQPEIAAQPARSALLGRLARLAPPEVRSALIRETLDEAGEELAAVEHPTATARIEDPHGAAPDTHFREVHVSSALRAVAEWLPGAWIPEALETAMALTSAEPRVQALACLVQRLDEAERAPRVEALLEGDPHGTEDADSPNLRRLLVDHLGGFLPLARRLALEKDVASADEPPRLWPDLAEADLLARLDRWLASDKHSQRLPDALRLLALGLPPPRRGVLLSAILERIRPLLPSFVTQVLVRLLPYLPGDAIDHYFDLARAHGIGGAWALGVAALLLDGPRLDLALELLEKERSSGRPHDARLESIGHVGGERLKGLARTAPRRGHLRELLHKTLRDRSETRADALLVLRSLRPIVVGLGGAPAAVGAVRAIREAHASWR